jgi:hypothetical protein
MQLERSVSESAIWHRVRWVIVEHFVIHEVTSECTETIRYTLDRGHQLQVLSGCCLRIVPFTVLWP